MKTSLRIAALAILGGAVLIAPPVASSMDVRERTVTMQTQSIRQEAAENQRRKAAEAEARAYQAKHSRAVRPGARTHTPAGQDRQNSQGN